MNNNKDQAKSQENNTQTQPCCEGGNCCPSDSDGSGKNLKMAVFILIVIAAGVVLARSFIVKSNADAKNSQQAFTAIQIDNKPEIASLSKVIEKSRVVCRVREQDRNSTSSNPKDRNLKGRNLRALMPPQTPESVSFR